MISFLLIIWFSVVQVVPFYDVFAHPRKEGMGKNQDPLDVRSYTSTRLFFLDFLFLRRSTNDCNKLSRCSSFFFTRYSSYAGNEEPLNMFLLISIVVLILLQDLTPALCIHRYCLIHTFPKNFRVLESSLYGLASSGHKLVLTPNPQVAYRLKNTFKLQLIYECVPPFFM